MYEWHKNVQKIVDEIDVCIKNQNDEALTLEYLADNLGYSEFYISRKFKEISGMQFRDYLRYRRLAFALKEVRDTEKGILDILDLEADVVINARVGFVGLKPSLKSIETGKVLALANKESLVVGGPIVKEYLKKQRISKDELLNVAVYFPSKVSAMLVKHKLV